VNALQADIVYYRLKYTDINGNKQYSQIIAENIAEGKTGIQLLRNGISGSQAYLSLSAVQNTDAKVEIYNQAGATVMSSRVKVQKGVSVVRLDKLEKQASGVYFIKVIMENTIFSDKLLLIK
jgi:hypothetical protein